MSNPCNCGAYAHSTPERPILHTINCAASREPGSATALYELNHPDEFPSAIRHVGGDPPDAVRREFNAGSEDFRKGYLTGYSKGDRDASIEWSRSTRKFIDRYVQEELPLAAYRGAVKGFIVGVIVGTALALGTAVLWLR